MNGLTNNVYCNQQEMGAFGIAHKRIFLITKNYANTTTVFNTVCPIFCSPIP